MLRWKRYWLVVILLLSLAIPAAPVSAAEGSPKKIVLIAGQKSHGPEGNGIHDYPWSVKLLKVLLDSSNARDAVRVEYHLDGWPRDASTLDSADAIMVISDGRDGDLYAEAPHFANEAQLALVDRQMRRGCGFLTFHFSTFAPDKYARQILDWSGGYFDWETDGARKWYSAIRVLDTDVQLGSPDHPVSRGVKPFQLKEEFYYNLRFGAGDKALRPLLVVPTLDGRQPDGNVVAWARERADGGRGFGTTCGHFYDNWRNSDFRRLILNALVWAAKAEVPAGGVQTRFYEREELVAALEGKSGTEPAPADDRPIRVLLVAGNAAHKWHNWETTTPAIKQLLELDPRLQVDISFDIEDLTVKKLSDYQVLVQNYANWHDPRGISEAARGALIGFVRQGGGLILVHFANGAFHFSLPEASASDWPEYRKLVRRVWNHHGTGEAKSGHDAFGTFTVRPTDLKSPLTAGLGEFDVTDELYFRQDGDEPIEPLITAKSKVTARDEPLAWVYRYGQGRVFQTLLGHSEKTYDTFEPGEMLRRAVAWSAGRTIVARPPPAAPAASQPKPAATGTTPVPKPTRVALIEGRFGKALDARQHGLLVDATEALRVAPLTVECWARIDHKQGFQILVASEEKSSPTHWELYAYTGSGVLSVYMPGRGGEFKSEVDVCDGKWHHLAMVLEATRLQLFVDARPVLDRPIADGTNGKPALGQIGIGRLVEGTLGCAGTIDELRITRGVLAPKAAPETAPRVEESTVGLWRFDAATEGQTVPDESKSRLPAKLTDAGAGTSKPGTRKPERPIVGALPEHWGVESVGFNWTEADSRDDRWKDMELGRFQASSLPLPGAPLRKGLSIRVGSSPMATVAFDTEFLRWRAAWTGGFLAFDPARYGLISPPQPAGPLVYSTLEGPGWNAEQLQFVGLNLQGDRVVLTSRVGSTIVRESPWFEELAGVPTLTRTIELSAGAPILSLHQFELGPVDQSSVETNADWRRVIVTMNDRRVAAVVRGEGLRWQVASNAKSVRLVMDGSAAVRRFKLWIASIPPNQLDAWTSAIAATPDVEPLEPLVEPGPARWTKEIVTRGQRAPDTGPYVLDTLTIPHENPYKALFFPGGHDFLPNGDVVVCTAHGDVWRVSGVNDSLERLVWKRMATGLFQPLGLKIVDGQIFVLGRDQITRLIDHNGDGEADEYACVNNQAFTSYGGHDYVTCLERSTDGWFYFMHATQGMVRASSDGQRLEIVATGFRNPNGMGLGPNGELSASPQEGEWVPASSIALVKQDGYYGYGGPRVTAERPRGYDLPLCFIPRMVDNSSGGQTWIAGDRWGPLRGMLHFSFGKCRMLLVLQESVPGATLPDATNPTPPASVRQGGTIAFPFTFAAGAHRGRFSPHDGQLYVTGLKGWVSSAVQDGCLQRVRYTGQPVDMPVRVQCLANGLAIEFTRPLDRAQAEDPENYSLQQWNYRYAAAYGSADWKVSDARQEGHDTVDVRSATLLDDGRTVFLEVDPLVPANQLEIQYSLRTQDGQSLRDILNYTVHSVNTQRMDASKLARREPTSGLAPAETVRLRSGLLMEVTQVNRHARLPVRLAAIAVPPGGIAATGFEPRAFQANLTGYLQVPLRGEFQFRIQGHGDARLLIAGRTVAVLAAANRQNAAKPDELVALHKGPNRLELQYNVPASSGSTAAEVRVHWKGEGFGWEPIPSTALAFLPVMTDDSAAKSGAARNASAADAVTATTAKEPVWGDLDEPGWLVAARHHCLRCHGDESSRSPVAGKRRADSPSPPSLDTWLWHPAPSLANAGGRFRRDWLQTWLLDPRSVRPEATMPQLFDAGSEASRQEAADLTAYLLTLGDDDAKQASVAAAPAPALADSAADGSAESRRQKGLALYEDLGCIACHRRTIAAEAHEPSPARISLARTSEKFSSGQIARFLQAPFAHDPWRRMPDFRLTAAEAAALEAWLRHADATEPLAALPSALPARVAGDAARGQRLFGERRCVACHAVDSQPVAVAVAVAVAKLPVPLGPFADAQSVPRGCLAEQDERRGRAPRFQLTPRERARLGDWVRHGQPQPLAISLVEAARHFTSELRCQSCHSRDGQTSPRGLLIAEEGERGLPPEVLPSLSWAGDKLRPAYLERLFAGQAGTARPWLKARMPGFPAYAVWLAHGLAVEHGYLPTDSPRSSIPSDLAALGDRLTQKDALDCRQCHAVGQDKPRGDANTQIALGVNFDLIRERVRYDYYSRFLLNPPRYDLGTKMPVLAPDGKSTRIAHVLEGDARRQFDAVWAFIESRAPAKAESNRPSQNDSTGRGE